MTSSRPPRALVVLPAKGTSDMIMLLPALEMLMESLPYAEVSIGYTNSEQEEVLKLATLSLPALRLRGWLRWENRGWLRKPVEMFRNFRHNLRLMRAFDQVVFLEAERLVPRIWVRAALWARARVLLHAIEEGYFTANRCVYYQRAVAELLNVSGARTTRLPKLSPKPDDRQAADAIFKQSGLERKTVIYLDPTVPGGLEVRRWPLENFVVVAGQLVRRGASLLLPSHEEMPAEMAARITGPLPTHTQILPPLRLGPTAALLARCALYVGHDTARAHIALGVGTPAVTLFGPTSDEIYAGYSPLQTVVKDLSACPVAEGRSAPACPGCERFESSAPGALPPLARPYPCMESLSPTDVLAAVEKILSWKSRRERAPDEYR